MSTTNTQDKIRKGIDKNWDEFQNYTRVFSNILRQLAFAEGAVFWIFKSESPDLIKVTFLGLMFLIFFFLFDALQYYFGKVDYEHWAQSCEDRYKKCNEPTSLSDSDFEKPVWVNKRNEFYFHFKIFFIIASSLILSFQFIMIVFFGHCS